MTNLLRLFLCPIFDCLAKAIQMLKLLVVPREFKRFNFEVSRKWQKKKKLHNGFWKLEIWQAVPFRAHQTLESGSLTQSLWSTSVLIRV